MQKLVFFTQWFSLATSTIVLKFAMSILEQLDKLAMNEPPTDEKSISEYLQLYESTFREWLKEEPHADTNTRILATRRLLTDGPVRS